jgi:secreted Zn-dependent insulinase-like peptidase
MILISKKNFLQQKELKDNTFLYYYYINDFLGETNHVTIINYQMRLDKSKSDKGQENIFDFQKAKIYNSLYSKCIGNLFFTKLRTEKQLGYIVANSFSSYDQDTTYFSIIVQGIKKFPEEIDLEINEVLHESININCHDNFEELKNSLLFDKKSNENNLEERTEFFKIEINNMKYNFEEKKQNIEIINSIKDYEEVIKYIKYNFIEKPRRIGIFNYANTTSISDVKRRIDYFKISNGLNDYYLKNKNIFTDKVETIDKYLI